MIAQLQTNPEQLHDLLQLTNRITKAMNSLQSGTVTDMNSFLQVLQNTGLMSGTAMAAMGNIPSGRCFIDLSLAASSLSIVSDNMNNPNFTIDDLDSVWGLTMLDASAKPGPSILRGNTLFLGNYKQCQEVKYQDPNDFRKDVEAHICRATLSLDLSAFPALANSTQFNTGILWDFCLPKSCKGPELKGFFDSLNISFVSDIDCTADAYDISGDAAALVSVVILVLFGVLMVAGTFMDLYVRFRTSDGRDDVYIDAFNTKHGYLNAGADLQETSFTQPPAIVVSEHQDANVVDYSEGYSTNSPYPPDNDARLRPNGAVSGTTPPRNLYNIPEKHGNYPQVNHVDSNAPWTTKTELPRFAVGTAIGAAAGISHWKPTYKPQDKEEKDDTADLNRWQLALLSFSLPRNAGRILSVKESRGNISCLHGIRVLSMAWVILGHAILMMGYGGTINKLDVFELQSTLSFQLIVNAPLAVDSFFFLSGFLTCYTFLRECGQQEHVTGKKMGLYYLHRYIRLTPSMMMWVMITATLLKYVGEGRPDWHDYEYAPNCREHWWTNLLYINTLVGDHDCVGVTWFLSQDMMFYMIAPLALVPFVYKIDVLGIVVSALLVAVHVSTNLWVVTKYNTDIYRNPSEFSRIYFKPWARVAPFAIGLIIGWVVWKHRGSIKMKKITVLIGWIVAIGTALTLTLVSYDENRDYTTITEGNWPLYGRVILETFRRPVWALVLSWIVIACVSGYGGFINSILSWTGWLPLSRLSYGAYLTHMTVQIFNVMHAETNFMFTLETCVYKFLAFYVLAHCTGFVLAVAVEMPVIGIERAIFKKR